MLIKGCTFLIDMHSACISACMRACVYMRVFMCVCLCMCERQSEGVCVCLGVWVLKRLIIWSDGETDNGFWNFLYAIIWCGKKSLRVIFRLLWGYSKQNHWKFVLDSQEVVPLTWRTASSVNALLSPTDQEFVWLTHEMRYFNPKYFSIWRIYAAVRANDKNLFIKSFQCALCLRSDSAEPNLGWVVVQGDLFFLCAFFVIQVYFCVCGLFPFGACSCFISNITKNMKDWTPNSYDTVGLNVMRSP